jgi:3-sulfinopropanoyl-CoA desulfinase
MPEAELEFHGLEVPDAMVLRRPAAWARGFGRLMDAYNGQRVGAATVALGLAAGASTTRWPAQTRRQFGRPIAEFQGLGWMLADMSIEVEAARALIWRAARSAGPAASPTGWPPQAKVLAADMAIRVTNAGAAGLGREGYSRDNPMERYVRDARMFAIAGGTAQVLRNQVAEQILGRKLPQNRATGPPRRPRKPKKVGGPGEVLFDALAAPVEFVRNRRAFRAGPPKPKKVGGPGEVPFPRLAPLEPRRREVDLREPPP